MVNAKRFMYWKCEECKRKHEFYNEAEECCQK